MVNAVRSLALCACTLSAFIISGVDMGVFLLIPCLTVVRSSETVPLRHVPAQRSPYCDVLLDCSYGTCGHTLSVVLYCHEVIGAVSHSRSTPVAQLAPRNLLTRWDVSSIPANGIFLTKN